MYDPNCRAALFFYKIGVEQAVKPSERAEICSGDLMLEDIVRDNDGTRL